MKEVRLHGRGGQGVVMAAHILGTAFVACGKYASSFPMFGVERRGSPVASFIRFGNEPVREKCKIYNPDCLIIFNSTALKVSEIFNGLKPRSILVRNLASNASAVGNFYENFAVIATVDATKIALEEIGVAVCNTCMLGAFAHATDWISLDALVDVLGDFFSGKRLKSNIRSCTRGFEEVKILKISEVSKGLGKYDIE
jgi:2-oxoacid:acceptor oxidoreductase gamma subunit (pyruvate/2-ketoisovalerate family)